MLKLNVKRIQKKIISFNMFSLFFVILSGVSLTFAWFAYNNIVKNSMEIDVLAWNIEFTEENTTLSNELTLNIDNFYPGTEKYYKTFDVHNKGDIDAIFTYNISYLRIFEEEFNLENQEELFDKLSHDYPFSFNIVADSNFIGKQESISVTILVEWPLDSGNDALDGQLGSRAYSFIKSEKDKKSNDSNYIERTPIEIKVQLNSKQYVAEENINIIDNRYLTGNIYNFDRITHEICSLENSNCSNYYVLDRSNFLNDETVNFILDNNDVTNVSTFNNIENNLNENETILTAEQVLKTVSHDLVDTNIEIPNTSKRILGNIDYGSRATTIINYVSEYQGKITFNKNIFNYLSSDTCIWTNTPYNDTLAYAIKLENENTIKLYGEDKNTLCKVVPVITKNK